MGGRDVYHYYPFQIRAHAARIFPSHGRCGTSTPCGDASMLFGQLCGVGTPDLEFEHRFAELDFAEEKEAGVVGDLGLAVVG